MLFPLDNFFLSSDIKCQRALVFSHSERIWFVCLCILTRESSVNCVINSNNINKSNFKKLENWSFEEQTLNSKGWSQRAVLKCPESS